MQLSLSARQYSPKAELFRQLAAEALTFADSADACCFVELHGAAGTPQIVTDVGALEAAVKRAAGGGSR